MKKRPVPVPLPILWDDMPAGAGYEEAEPYHIPTRIQRFLEPRPIPRVEPTHD